MCAVYLNRSDSTSFCVSSRKTFVWLPGQTTTFVLPVIEIEDIIERLKGVVEEDSNPTDKQQLTTQIEHWETVLDTYRAGNDDFPPIFNEEALRFNSMANSFANYKTGQLSIDDFVNSLNPDLTYPSWTFNTPDSSTVRNRMNDLQGQFNSLTTTCDEVLLNPSADSSSFLNTVCSDLSAANWNAFAQLLTGACINLDNADPIVSTSEFSRRMCRTEDITDPNNEVPGGVAGGTASLFGFLSSTTPQFVTFGAYETLEMSWKSEITNSKTFTVGFTVNQEYSLALNLDTENVIGIVDIILKTGGELSITALDLSLEKQSGTSHVDERVITVEMGDDDDGTFILLCFVLLSVCCAVL